MGAIAALVAGAMLAGPALAQEAVEARTGNVHQDCDRVGLDIDTNVVAWSFVAWCRVSDDSGDKERTSISLNDYVGAKDGGLSWRTGTRFLWACNPNSAGVARHGGGVTLTATCWSCSLRLECLGRRFGEAGTSSSLELGSHLRVNTAGKLEVN